MAPIPQNNTPRLWVKYTSGPYEHEIMFRVAGAEDGPDAINVVDPVITAMQSAMSSEDSIIGARFASEGSDFSLPFTYGPFPGLGTPGQSAGDPESRYIDFLGRDGLTGRKVRWTLFTRSNAVPVPLDNRLSPGESAVVDDIVTSLAAAAEGPVAGKYLCTVSGNSPVVYTYANSGWNYHWVRRQRT